MTSEIYQKVGSLEGKTKHPFSRKTIQFIKNDKRFLIVKLSVPTNFMSLRLKRVVENMLASREFSFKNNLKRSGRTANNTTQMAKQVEIV